MRNKNVELMRGDPEIAIKKLAIPIIISMLLTASYNIIDGVWVAGLGPDALAAVGFVPPLFLAMVGFANGLGAGSNSLIARCIGAEDYHAAGNSAIHSMMLSIIVTAIATVFMLISMIPCRIRPVLLRCNGG